jgi:hypothetical protein
MALPKRKPRNLAVQRLCLMRLFPASCSWIRRSELTWESDLTPTPLSHTYRVRLTYKLTKAPRVEVVSPALERRNNTLPHVYPGDRLCLFLPRIGEWSSDKLLAATIVPWTSEWLASYEDWLFTGRWHAGGTHSEYWDGSAADPPPKKA